MKRRSLHEPCSSVVEDVLDQLQTARIKHDYELRNLTYDSRKYFQNVKKLAIKAKQTSNHVDEMKTRKTLRLGLLPLRPIMMDTVD